MGCKGTCLLLYIRNVVLDTNVDKHADSGDSRLRGPDLRLNKGLKISPLL